MEHPVGIDVSLELSSLCVLDATGRVLREAKVASEPEALVAFLCGLDVTVVRVGLEADPCRSGSTTGCMRRSLRPCCWKRGTSKRRCNQFGAGPGGSAPTRFLGRDAETVRQVPLQWPGAISRLNWVDCSAGFLRKHQVTASH